MIRCEYCDEEILEGEVFYEVDGHIACEECQYDLWDDIKEDYQFRNNEKEEWEQHNLDELRGK